VLTLDRTLEDALPYLFSLLGIGDESASLVQMDPQIRRQSSRIFTGSTPRPRPSWTY
jgi:hypothetical protein